MEEPAQIEFQHAIGDPSTEKRQAVPFLSPHVAGSSDGDLSHHDYCVSAKESSSVSIFLNEIVVRSGSGYLSF